MSLHQLCLLGSPLVCSSTRDYGGAHERYPAGSSSYPRNHSIWTFFDGTSVCQTLAGSVSLHLRVGFAACDLSLNSSRLPPDRGLVGTTQTRSRSGRGGEWREWAGSCSWPYSWWSVSVSRGYSPRTWATIRVIAPTAACGSSNSMLCPLCAAKSCWLLEDNWSISAWSAIH